MGLNGLEPLTPALSERCSNQLSYRPGLSKESEMYLNDGRLLRRCNGWRTYRPIYSLKEVIQPHLPVRLPCYDLAPVKGLALDARGGFEHSLLPWLDGRCVQGPGTYSPWCADPRLLAIPASRSRVADSDPN